MAWRGILEAPPASINRSSEKSSMSASLSVKRKAEHRESFRPGDMDKTYLKPIEASSIRCWKSACVLLMIAPLLAAGLLLGGCKAEAASGAGLEGAQADALFTQLLDRRIGTDWYGIYMQGNKIGHGKLETRRQEAPGGTTYRIILTGTMRFKSLGDIVEVEMSNDAEFEVRPPYALKRYSEKMISRDDISEATIFVTPKGYGAKIVQGNETRTQIIGPFDYTLKHLLAVETWIQKKPKVGERIEYPVPNCDTLELEQITSKIKAIRSAIVNGVRTRYYEISTTGVEGLELVMLYGEDSVPYTISFGKLFEFRLEPKTLAMKLDKPIDLFLKNMVRIDRALGKSEKVIRLRLAMDDVSGALIGNAPGQTVKKDEANERYIVTIDPNGGPRIEATDDEIDKNLKGTTEIPIDHQKVVALAQEAVGDAKTAPAKLKRLVKFVDRYIEDDLTANPLTLLDIISKRKGDCSEHADLFTALARSQAIPCRKVSGLVYLGDEYKGFGQHVWNEVAIDGFWVPVDSTWGQTMIDATHLRFPVNINEEWQITAAIPKMRITVLDVELEE